MTTISDERLADRMEQAAKNVERHAAKQKCWPGDNDYEDAANLLREGAIALRAQGGVRVSPALLQGVCDSLRAAIYEYEDRDVFPGARTIMQAQLDAILSFLEASPAPVSKEMARRFIKRYREIWPGAGWPSLSDATDLLRAALAEKGGQ